MALDPIDPATLDFILQVERHYSNLIAVGGNALIEDSQSGLGGNLLYVGELDATGRALLVAGNIAGAASLAATADQARQKQAIRDGVADFLVTTLSEALRILKNQIRKCETVAVCIASSRESLEQEMLERGVLPDLLRPAGELSALSPFVHQGSQMIPSPTTPNDSVLLTWRVASAPALWLPKLDAISIDCLQTESAHRWLRLAPRYLGRTAQSVHLISRSREFAAEFIERTRDHVNRGEVAVEVEIQVTDQGINNMHRLSPPGMSA